MLYAEKKKKKLLYFPQLIHLNQKGENGNFLFTAVGSPRALCKLACADNAVVVALK